MLAFILGMAAGIIITALVAANNQRKAQQYIQYLEEERKRLLAKLVK